VHLLHSKQEIEAEDLASSQGVGNCFGNCSGQPKNATNQYLYINTNLASAQILPVLLVTDLAYFRGIQPSPLFGLMTVCTHRAGP
jgi:hypothetical protein